MKINNTKTKTSSGLDLNDKDYLNNLLSTLKCNVKNYATMITEMSNEDLVKDIEKLFQETLQMQRATYLLMFQNGWYSLEAPDSNKISTKYDNLLKEYEDLSN